LIIDTYTLIMLSFLLLGVFFLSCNLFLASFLKAFFRGQWNGMEKSLSEIRSLSIIVPCRNEGPNIARKIDNLADALQTINLDFEVIFGSDGSTDNTFEIASEKLKVLEKPQWRIVEFPAGGKCSTLNKLVELSRGDIIVSTDADILIPGNAVQLTIREFQTRAGLGCLSCIPGFQGQDIGSQKYYWNIEDRIRNAESCLGRLIVVTGMFYAFRKELYEKVPNGVMADDLWIPLNILLKGYQCVQVEGLNVPYEKTDEKTEILRRKRVIVGGMDVVRRLWAKLVASPSLLFLVFFHKINRWALPVWVILVLAACAGLWPWFLACYAIGAGVLYLMMRRRFFTLLLALFSPLLAFWEVIGKNDFSRWEHTRKQ